MKRLMILTVGVCLLFAAVPVTAQSAADEAAVREAAKGANAAWNKQDIEAFSARVDERAETWGGTIKGKKATLDNALQSWERQKDGQWKLLEEIGVAFVTSDVAIYKTRYETSGFRDSSGNPEPPAKVLVAQVMVKRNGKWLQNVFLSRPIEE
jgi:hypothetical protein